MGVSIKGRVKLSRHEEIQFRCFREEEGGGGFYSSGLAKGEKGQIGSASFYYYPFLLESLKAL